MVDNENIYEPFPAVSNAWNYFVQEVTGPTTIAQSAPLDMINSTLSTLGQTVSDNTAPVGTPTMKKVIVKDTSLSLQAYLYNLFSRSSLASESAVSIPKEAARVYQNMQNAPLETMGAARYAKLQLARQIATHPLTKAAIETAIDILGEAAECYTDIGHIPEAAAKAAKTGANVAKAVGTAYVNYNPVTIPATVAYGTGLVRQQELNDGDFDANYYHGCGGLSEEDEEALKNATKHI